MADPRRELPSVRAVTALPQVKLAAGGLHPDYVKFEIRNALDDARSGRHPLDHALDQLVTRLSSRPVKARSVINATGVLVHTNLGRATLPAQAVAALTLAAGNMDLELSLETGKRGARGASAIEAVLARVPAAEDAVVVNNGAAALALIANTLARKKQREVLMSRGEIVEIGAGFRIRDIIETSGATPREVGSTNRTHLRDYQSAISKRTAFILKVHSSNFTIEGFTSEVPVQTLASHEVPVVVDIGSGLLAPHPKLRNEPDASTALRAGAAAVVMSGDKLLGGPQCGVILGKRDLLQSLRANPLYRSFRLDKLRLAALEAVLRSSESTVLDLLDLPLETLQQRAQSVFAQVKLACPKATLSVVETTATVGGGSAPGDTFPSCALGVQVHLETYLRSPDRPLPVLGRKHHGELLLNFASVAAAQDADLTTAVIQALHSTVS